MLNFFTLSGEGEDTKLFDGQQRTVSSLLFVSSFIRKLDELNKKDAAEQLYKGYLVNSDFLTDPPIKTTKLKFENSEVNEFFLQISKAKC